MGKILGFKSTGEDKVIVNLELTQTEVLWLKGNIEKIHIFSENNLDFESRLVQRGKRESTKYFLLPKEFRKDVIPTSVIKCNMIDTKTKQIFVFEVPKYQ